MGLTRYLVDKSALARLHLPPVRDELEPLIERALVGMCGVTKLEMLFSARNIAERARMKQRLQESLEPIATPENVWDLASSTPSPGSPSSRCAGSSHRGASDTGAAMNCE